MLATSWFFCLFDASLLFAADTVVLHWNAKIPSSIEVLLVLECRGSMVMFLFGLLFRLVQAIVVSDRTIFLCPVCIRTTHVRSRAAVFY